MTKRHPDEVILARWTVDPLRVREFTRRVRERFGTSPFSPADLLRACEQHPRSGLEVVCREDALFVGTWCLAFQYNLTTDIRLEAEWLLFEMEGGLYDIPIPIAEGGREEPARMAAYYLHQIAEEEREAIAKRSAPTWSNRLLDVVEAHWVWVFLGVFFVGIPLIVVLVSLLRGDFR